MATFSVPVLLSALFIGWVGFHLFIKKDLKKYFNELLFGVFFIGMWVFIYWFIMHTTD